MRRLLSSFCFIALTTLSSVPALGQSSAGSGISELDLKRITTTVECKEGKLALDRVLIVAADAGVRISGTCEFTLTRSVIRSDGVAIISTDEASVTVKQAEVSGSDGAFKADGKSTLRLKDALLSGSTKIGGDARYFDQGGNERREDAQASGGPVGELKPEKPKRCIGKKELIVEGRAIRTPRRALVIQGACKVTLRNVHLESDDEVILIQGSPEVAFENVSVVAKERALVIVGAPTITVRNSSFVGKIQKTGKATIIDLGGTSYR